MERRLSSVKVRCGEELVTRLGLGPVTFPEPTGTEHLLALCGFDDARRTSAGLEGWG